ncbi:MAG: phosphoribosylanthranilate isomerase [Desulfofustis sp.]|nr:phosphoribosylanthranilate isomerase [Desulfofustis sp.]
MRVRIKMCGTTRAQDAEAAVALGVDALGFIFAEKSPRYVTPELASELIETLPPFIARVGVFVDCDPEQVKKTVVTAGLTQVQLHGKESVDYCRNLKNWNRSLTICKSFLVGTQAMDHALAPYYGVIDCVLFDTYVKGQDGGTGRTFDWEIVGKQRFDVPMILAGGLNPDNVAEAIKMTAPYAVDVNSGIEDHPGAKNHELLARLVANVRAAEQQLSA